MKLKKVQLVQFKRFHDLTIDLGENPAKIVALVGPNGCGKSSIFDAFEEQLKEIKGTRHNLPASFFSKLFFDLLNPTEVYDKHNAVRLTAAEDGHVFDKKSFYLRSSYRFTPKLLVDNIRKQPDILNDEQRPASSIELDPRLRENYERLLGNAYEAFEQGNKTGNEVRAELIGQLNTILNNVLDIEVTSLGNVIDGKGQLYFRKGGSSGFPYDNLSSGEKEVIDMVLDLIVKVPEFNDTVYAIDEPELHLNTAIQRRLIVELEKLVPDNCQLWVATHSIGFLRALQAELKDKTAVIDLHGHDLDGEVAISPMVPSRKNWHRIFETALDDLTGLLSPEVIIYCEGRPEPDANGREQGLDADVYNQIFGSEYPNALFVSSGGNTTPDKYAEIALKVLSKAFEDVKLVLLKDMDINADGSATSSAQRAAWLQDDPINRRMLLRREIENYLIDLDVLHAAGYVGTEEEYRALVGGDIATVDVKPVFAALKDQMGFHALSVADFKRHLAGFVRPETAVYQELVACVFPSGDQAQPAG